MEALIVGAGPAGLATSRELSRRGVEHVVLERGDQIAHTWANLYDGLVLHTARGLSVLPGLDYPAGTPIFPSRRDFVAYLHRYAETFRVPVETRAEVARLRRADGGWVAQTTAGSEIHARAAIIATGIVSNPCTPHVPNRDAFRGRVLHSVEYRRPDGFAGQRVLVVGAGNSAGEISAELAGGSADVTVAVRSGTNVVPREILGMPIQYVALVMASLPKPGRRAAEIAIARLSALMRGPSLLPPARPRDCGNVPMIGFHLSNAVRAGTIRLAGGVAAFTSTGVRFVDGSERAFDTVILATGYKAALGMLAGAITLDQCGFARRRDRVVSADHPDLFFVGQTYDVRGALYNIARDAARAARCVTEWTAGRSRTSTETRPPRSGR